MGTARRARPPRQERANLTGTLNREIQIVGFQVGRETYGIPITALHEIVRIPEITAIPDAPAHLEGVINLRGKIISVVDLRKRFGKPATELTRHSRILVVEHRNRLVGMIVDSASEVLKVAETEIEPAPAMMKEGGLDCVTGLGKFQKRLIILLDIDRVLTVHEVNVTQSRESGPGKSGHKSPAEAKSACSGN